MFYSSPEALGALGANMQMEHDVLAIDPVAKTVEVKDLKTGNVTTNTYGKLVYTTGSTPIVPNIPGIHDTDVHLCKNWHDAKALKALAPTIKSAIVIGAGYIGAELAEQYALTDKQVTLIDGLPRVLAKNFDATITDRVEKLYTDHGVNLELGEMVTGFDQGTDGEMTVTTDKGSYTADIAILCTGFRPNTELLKDHLETLPNGAVITDVYMQTSDPAIFAAGDTATVHYNPTGKNDYIPLATNAVRQGILVGKNIEKPTEKYLGTNQVQRLNFSNTPLLPLASPLKEPKPVALRLPAWPLSRITDLILCWPPRRFFAAWLGILKRTKSKGGLLFQAWHQPKCQCHLLSDSNIHDNLNIGHGRHALPAKLWPANQLGQRRRHDSRCQSSGNGKNTGRLIHSNCK